MLNRENNLFSYLVIYLFMQSACSSKQDKMQEYVNKNSKSYEVEYKILQDSIRYYIKNNLQDFIGVKYNDWRIDSLICINKDGDKLVTTSNSISTYEKKAWSEEVIYLYGKKIDNKWYFFQGASLAVPREMYGKDENHPLTFKELSDIAREEMFGENCLIKKDGEWVVNDAWVDSHFYNNGYYTFGKKGEHGFAVKNNEFQMPRDKAKFDSVHWQIILDKWKHKIDTSEFRKK